MAHADQSRKPRISVVVPVYNKSEYLEGCISSLAHQRCAPGFFEVVLVDDGSKDDSLEKCRELAERYRFIRVFTQENQGVSSARNLGIRQSRGDYIMFLDSDDSITNTTIPNVVETFDKFGDGVDLVTYPLEYYYASTGKTRRHEREEWLTVTGMYPLDRYPFIAQTTMNVCVRNRGADNILFDKSLKMGEDQLYITQNLERTGVLGFADNALYHYVRDGSNSSTRNNNPLYAYEDMLALYGYLEQVAASNEKMAAYCHQVVLYNVAWRLKSTMLFPTYCRGEEYERQMERLAHIMRKIPPCEYAKSPYIAEYHKAKLMQMYGKVDPSAPRRYTQDHAIVALMDGAEWNTNPPKLTFNRMYFERGVLTMRGRLICPTFLLEDKPSLALVVDGARREVELGPSSYDYVQSHYAMNKAWSVKVDFEIAPSEKRTVDVEALIGGLRVQAIEVEIKPSVHNARRLKEVLYFDGVTVAGKLGQIILDSRNVNGYKAMMAAHMVVNPGFIARRLAIKKHAHDHKGRRVWLYSDLPTSASEGNGLIQMLHDLQQDDGITRFYVSNHGKELEEKHPELKGHVVKLRSRDHQYLTFEAELIISAYLERFIRMPLKVRTYNHLGDLTRPQRLVYLQHGILHAHIPWYFSYDRIAHDYEVVSTDFEIENLTANYNFPREAILPTGAPRLDMLSKRPERTRKAVYAPSWRAYLLTGTAAQREGIESAFKASSLYNGMKGFIESVSASGVLEDEDWTLDIKLHPNFECYQHLFEFEDPRVNLLGSEIDPSEYDTVITDFSSFVYDFVYAGADVMYFLPDHQEFSAGLNHYLSLDWPLDDALGPYCETVEQACETLESMMRGSGDSPDHARYKSRVQNLFLHHDGKNAERLYGVLQEIARSLS